MSKELQDFLSGSVKFQVDEAKFWFNLVKYRTMPKDELQKTLDALLSNIFKKDSYQLEFEGVRHFRCMILFYNNQDVVVFQSLFGDEIKRLG